MTSEQAERLVKKLILVYPQGQRIEPETAAIYAALLSRFEYDEANAAIINVCETEKFFPAVAVIIDAIVAARVTHLPNPMAAWELVLQWEGDMRQWRLSVEREERELTNAEWDEWQERGRPALVPKPQQPPDAAVRALKMVGGVDALRHADTDNIGVMRAHFRDAYLGLIQELEREARAAVTGPRRLELQEVSQS